MTDEPSSRFVNDILKPEMYKVLFQDTIFTNKHILFYLSNQSGEYMNFRTDNSTFKMESWLRWGKDRETNKETETEDGADPGNIAKCYNTGNKT